MSAAFEAAGTEEHDPFAGEELAAAVPTTEPQREVWLADQLGTEASLAYNESMSLRLRGALRADALAGAVKALFARHESLRATFTDTGEQMLVAAHADMDVPLLDWSSRPAPERERALAELRREAVETPFDLARGPLFRATIARLAADDHVLVLASHHLVCDGWSAGVLMRDLAALYAHAVGAGSPPPPAASFARYAAARREALHSPQQAQDEAYWLAQFAGSAPVLDLPTDRPRAPMRRFDSRREDVVLDADLVAAVRKMGAKQGASLFSTLLAGFAAIMHRASGADDVVVGVPFAGQSTEPDQALVGHCVNLLPVRLRLDPARGLDALVEATQSAMLDAQDHQAYTFGTLLKKLALPRDTSRLPLVSVMFNLDQALDVDALGFPGLQAELAINPRSYENFELFVNAVQVGGALRFECQYNTALFDAATIRRWMDGYAMLLREACADAAKPVGRLAWMTPADQATLAGWNATHKPYAADTVHRLVERQAARAPTRTAIAFGGRPLTYGALESAANRLARELRARGVRRGALVGLHLRRGPSMVVALLAALKAGAAYVPLDPAYPVDRLAFMAADAKLAVLVSEADIAQVLAWPRDRLLLLDTDAAAIAAQADAPLADDGDAATPDDRAYVIYTSGSTGKPKGVQVHHRAVANFLASMAQEPGLAEGDRLLAVTTLSFDIAVNELLLPLSRGACVVLAGTDEATDGAALLRLIGEHDVTVMQATPATWRLLLEAGWRGTAALRAWCGGEALSAELAGELLPRCAELWNLYGPTETTVWSTCARVDSRDAISIGRPIANTQVWVLDAQRQACPIGVPGELCIGGDGVTLGYLGRPELTAERFIPDPFAGAGARLYRTGDRGRWRGDGTLEHLGRLDFQVKVRGYRIELGEIEAALDAVPGVTESVVMAREDRPGDVRLVGYVVAQGPVDEAAAKAQLRRSLPEYMLPQHIVVLPAMPRLPNGKVDRRALPAPNAAAPERAVVLPRTPLEKAVATEMEAVLGLPGIGVDDDFFSLGGHSLLAAQLTTRLNRVLGSQLAMRAIFAAPTVAKLAALVEAKPAAVAFQPIKRLAERGTAPLSIMQERLFFLEELNPGRVTYNAPSAHRLLGPLHEDAFQRAFDEIFRRQPSLRTSFVRDGDTIVQRIHDDVRIGLFPAEDLSALPEAEREQQLRARLEALTDQTFDLAQVPLAKARLFRLGPQDHVLFFMPHHIMWDGWSFDLLYKEMSALYGAFAAGRPSPLPELPVTYGDFAAWHHEFMQGDEFKRQLAFWRQRLESVGALRDLPTDKPRRPGMSGVGATQWVKLTEAQIAGLHALGRSAGTTMFAATLAVYATMLHGYSGQRVLAIGSPVRGRPTPELEDIMGFFNNLVPLHLAIDPSETFAAFLARVKATVVEGFGAPDVPLERLARELTVGSGSAAMLYQALFSYQDGRQRIRRWGDLAHANVPLFQRGATEDLGMWFLEVTGSVQGGITYNADIFSEETAIELHRAYVAILDAAIADPGQTLARLIERSGLRMRAPAAEAARAAPAATTPPATPTEKLLATVWKELLRVDAAREDNFFDLGGHSLLAMQAILAMESRTGKRVEPNRYIFETLAQIARGYDEAPVAPAPAQKKAGLRGLLAGLLGGDK